MHVAKLCLPKAGHDGRATRDSDPCLLPQDTVGSHGSPPLLSWLLLASKRLMRSCLKLLSLDDPCLSASSIKRTYSRAGMSMIQSMHAALVFALDVNDRSECRDDLNPGK